MGVLSVSKWNGLLTALPALGLLFQVQFGVFLFNLIIFYFVKNIQMKDKINKTREEWYCN